MWSRFKTLVAALTSATSHRIGTLYLITCALYAIAGAVAALLIQVDMLTPVSQLTGAIWYGRLLTGHGMLMTFLVLAPLFPGVFGQLVLPAAVGATKPTVSRISHIGWLCHLGGGVLIVVALLMGAYDGGWTMMMPVAEMSVPFTLLQLGLALAALAVFLPSVAVLKLVLSRKQRTTSMAQLPLFAWFLFLGSLVQVVVAPIRLVTLGVVFGGPMWGWTYFSLTDPTGIARYQQAFWLYAGPAIVSLVLPAVGIIFEVLIARTRSVVQSRTAVVSSGIGLAILGVVSWSQHLVATPDGEFAVLLGCVFGLLMIFPASMILLQWIRCLARLRRPFKSPDIFVLMSIACSLLAGVAGAALAFPALAIHLHNTYFAVSHLHLALIGSIGAAVFAGLFHFWPQWWRATYSERTAKCAAIGILSGVCLAFLPMIALGAQGLPRSLYVYPEQYRLLHIVSSAGSFVLTGSLALAALTLLWGAARGKATLSQSDVSGGEFAYTHLSPGIGEK